MYNCLGVNRRDTVIIDISTIVKSINKETQDETFAHFLCSRLGDFPILKKSRYHFISQMRRMQQCSLREQLILM